MTEQEYPPATTYKNAFDVNRVQNYNPNRSYIVQLKIREGYYKSAPARFSEEEGWQFWHYGEEKWCSISDDIEIFDKEKIREIFERLEGREDPFLPLGQ